MSDESSDLSDFVNPRPSGSRSRLRSDPQKKKRRIVMRIEFDDSDEDMTSATSWSSDGEGQPMCSNQQRGCSTKQRSSCKSVEAANTDNDSDQIRRNSSRRRQARRPNVLSFNDSSTDSSSSGSEITQRFNSRRGKIVKKVIVSEDERDVNVGSSPQKRDEVQANKDEGGFASDSSSNDLLEKCPICLLTFRQQEIGSPATCVHIFCASCIEAWSKNMQTCPIDRIEFDRIVVRESFANRNIVREINVDSVVACEQQQQDLFVPGLEEAVEDEEPTNCEICESQEREDVMLLCDSCNQGYHIYCLTPPLDAIPEGSWYCDNCFDSQDESDDGEGIEEDLSLLYEDIRDMGIPQSRLRVTEVHQPRILRTRQNERIRAAVLRHTRSVTTLVNAAATATTTRRVGRPRTEITTAATTSSRMRIATRKKSSTARKPTCRRRRRRRRARQRTYVVEYDLNNLDEKFALKTTKKVVRRRKRKSVKKGSRPSSSTNQSGRRLTSSQRLAEQMGVKRERTFINPAHSAGTSALSLFGNPNELEYFSESDQGGGGYGSEIEIETGHGTAVQTSVRISTPGSLRSRKDLLLGRLQGNRPRAGALEINAPSASEQTDILSNILDLQDRWYNATRNLVSVYINSDGTLVLPTGSGDENNTTSENATTAANSRTPVNTAATEENQNPTPNINLVNTSMSEENQNRTTNINPANTAVSEGNQNPTPNISPAEMTQAPMHSQRGGGNQAFNSGGGGRYSNNNFSNQNNHRSGGGGSGSGGGNQYRHSIGGSVGGLAGNFNMVGRGNFSFSNPDYNSNQNQNPNSSFSSLNNRDLDRFNQRNRQQQRDNNNSNNVNTNQRHSFPFNNNQQSQQQRPPDGDNQLFEGQTPSQQMQRQHSPQRMAPQQIPPQHMAPQQIPPQPRPPQQMLSQHMSPHQQMPLQQLPPQQMPPQQLPPQQLPPQQMPPQQIPPQQMPPQQMPPQQMPPHPDRQSFGGLPPPMVSHLPPPPILNESQLFSGLPPPVAQQQQQHQMPPQNEPQLFGALPPPLAFGTHIPPPIAQQPPPAHLQPPILPSMSIPPPMVGPIIRSVPPPPAPPAALASWNSSLFSYAQDDDDDDSNCPNFSVYSQESQEVAKAAENKDVAAEGEPSKEDDENEDLVQLDDDDDIPVQTGNNTSQNSELYEPENPTEEIENESDNENENANNLKDSKASDNTGTDITEKERVIYETEKNIDDNHYDPEQETDTIHSLNEVTVEDGGLEKNDQHDTGAENISEKEESEKDEADEDKVPDDEESEADFEEEKEEEEENEHTNHNGDDGSNEKEAEKVEMENSAAVPEEETSASVPVKKITAEKGEDESDDDDEANCAENTKKIDSDGHTPSPVRPSIVHKKLPDADVSSSNRKGVLELYDDSDWDELDIDRPRSTERMDAFILAQVVEEEAKSNRDRTNDSNKEKNRDEDRSYTPCLDEKNDLEDEHNASVGAIQGGGTPELPNSALTKTITSSEKNNADDESEEGLVDEGTEVNTAIRADGISDEDKLEGRKEKRRKEKRSKRESERAETFKKVSNKQKERNYRSDKAEKQKERKRSDISPRSRSVTRSRSKSRSISRSPSRSRTRSRSRSRSLSRSRSRSRSRSHSHPRSPRPRSNSRLRSPRGGGFQRNRKRRFSRSPLLLRSSRSRSNDKENFFYVHNNNNYNHNYNYNHGYGFYNGRFQRGGFNNRFQNNRFYYRFGHRARRREMPRYDVRNIIGNSRNFHMKDRYGRDTSRPPHRSSRSLSHTRRRRSFSASRSRSFSVSPRRMRRSSFSISPSAERYRRSPRRRSFSPQNRHQARLRHSPATMYRRKSQSPLISSPIRNVRSSRSHSPSPRKGRKEKRHMQAGSPKVVRRKSRSVTGSPRYTPHLSRSRSGTPRSQSPRVRQKNKKKKLKERKKKKAKKRVAASKSPEPVRRISRQCDPYDLDLLPPEPPSKRQRHHSPPTGANDAAASLPIDERTWSPSPSPPPAREYENNISWTPPIASPREEGEFIDMFPSAEQRHDVPKPTTSGKKEKRKREKKKKKGEKRRDGVTNRKEKRRVARRTETPEPAPSKEVFASGNNILVSVSFNKEVTTGAANQPTQQTTVVTMPPSREDVVSAIRRGSTERLVTAIGPRRKKDRNHKRKKIDTKPVAIIDLERSPFQVHQEPADIIVLTDSEGANDDDEHDERRSEHHISEPNANEVENHHRPRLESSSGGGGGHTGGSHHEHTPPLLGTIIEETSFDIQPQTGPKTPPEPPVIKFTLLNKQQSKTRNPVHDAEDELNDVDEEEEEERMDMEGERMEQHRDDMEVVQTNQKIGPNTPPESGPRSPDVYDPFDPTKSPSLSPRSPTPPPLLLDKTPNSGGEGGPDVAEKHSGDERSRPMGERNTQQQVSTASAAGTGVSKTSTAPTMNPVELVMALMNSKQQTNSSQDMAAKSIESHYSAASSHVMTGVGNSAGQEESHAGSTIQNSSDDNNIASGIATSGITVLSNLLLSAAKPQHIPTISSPTPPMPIKSSHNMISKLPLPKVSKVVSGSSGSGGSGIGLSNSLRNGSGGLLDDSFDPDSPYSPASADYEDLFEPPPDNLTNSKYHSKRGTGSSKFDNLFGSSSPVGHLRLPSYTPSAKKYIPLPMTSGSRKLKVAKVGKSGDETIKVYDDVPNSAVELQVKDKFLRKLNRQERVVEEVKLILKPRFNKKQITKEDYKEIMRRAVPKICHSRSGEINPSKIKNLIDAYVKKFRAKHKKLNIINTGQVSSAVKCAAYLKKL